MVQLEQPLRLNRLVQGLRVVVVAVVVLAAVPVEVPNNDYPDYNF
jgi:hypothetical protein